MFNDSSEPRQIQSSVYKIHQEIYCSVKRGDIIDTPSGLWALFIPQLKQENV